MCAYVGMCPEALEPSEVEVIINHLTWVLGTEFESSLRAASIFNY